MFICFLVLNCAPKLLFSFSVKDSELPCLKRGTDSITFSSSTLEKEVSDYLCHMQVL